MLTARLDYYKIKFGIEKKKPNKKIEFVLKLLNSV